MRALILAVLTAAVLAAGASGATQGSGYFKTPSGKIVCGWATGGTPSAIVFCGELPTLHPPIPKSGTACQHLDYVGNRIDLSVTGKPELLPCVGDAGPFGDPGHTVFLHYGKTWSAGGISCKEATSGLTCRNRSGHGFFISLHSWHTF
ncbi:MAG TPA: DUF6636 domain-containing protein [Gaiellaceae bacterium]|nr:DUF6636 domain-containing protein [Gaiellaceae bacterium]